MCDYVINLNLLRLDHHCPLGQEAAHCCDSNNALGDDDPCYKEHNPNFYTQGNS